MELYDALKAYAKTDAYPFHMPGHKRRMGVPGETCGIDITEIDGFDNLHHAEGILKEAQEKAAKLYGADDTYYLVNGSTAGILAAISAAVCRGGKLLMARNSHKAAYHAAELRGLRTVYLYPRDSAPRAAQGQAMGPEAQTPCAARGQAAAYPRGCILAEDVRAALQRDREIEAVFITSPTYEGIVSDVAQIARAAHSFGVPLIVDEAHGAHFGFHPDFPETSVRLGADLVIHSLHKTLPSMTQTALLHRSGTLVDTNRIRKFLDIYQTSSPSYVMMASMDACVELLRTKGDTLFSDFSARLKKFYTQAKKLRHFYFLGGREAASSCAQPGAGQADLTKNRMSHDISRLVFGARGRSGKWLADTLRERFLLEMEMAAGAYVVAITTIADTQEGFDRLLAALHTLDEELEAHADPDTQPGGAPLQPEPVLTLAEAGECPHKRAALAGAAGQICAEYIYLYPPGIPLIVPGERISRALADQLRRMKRAGYTLHGMSDYSMETVEIV